MKTEMPIIEAALKERKLPIAVAAGEHLTEEQWAERKKKLINVMAREMFGFIPEKWRNLPMRVEPDEKKPFDPVHHCAGKIQTRLYNMIFTFEDGFEYKVPFVLHFPWKVQKPPVIMHIAFRREYPDRYLPVEEITDRGYAVLQFCYADATPDTMHSTYTNGLAERLVEKPRKADTWGNIGIWAYTAMRMMDWIEEQPDLDATRVTVSGHSRLGKTALWCGALDERFYCVFANCSGYGGTGLIRGKIGENISDFIRGGSWCWFCETFKDYVNKPAEELPYDMHFLTSAVAPRYLYIGVAKDDVCIDYTSDFLSAAAASNAWEALGYKGLVTKDELPVPGKTILNEGRIGYHVRMGNHYLSREDWGYFMDFMDKKLKE